MATCYGGTGDTSLENLESQDIDNDSHEHYQEEYVKFNPHVSLQHLTHEM